jgi:hypothetical protein
MRMNSDFVHTVNLGGNLLDYSFVSENCSAVFFSSSVGRHYCGKFQILGIAVFTDPTNTTFIRDLCDIMIERNLDYLPGRLELAGFPHEPVVLVGGRYIGSLDIENLPTLTEGLRKLEAAKNWLAVKVNFCRDSNGTGVTVTVDLPDVQTMILPEAPESDISKKPSRKLYGFP